MNIDEIQEASLKIGRLKAVTELLSKKHVLSFRGGAANYLDDDILEGAFMLQKEKLEKNLKTLGVTV